MCRLSDLTALRWSAFLGITTAQTPAGRRFQIVNATRGPNIRIKALDTGAVIDNSFIPILDANIFIKTVHGKDMFGDMIEREDVE